MEQGQPYDGKDPGGKYILIRDEDDPRLTMFDKPLPCFGCGIGWFSLLLGFVCPVMWYYAATLYFCNYYRKDPRERAGLAAAAIAVSVSASVYFPETCMSPKCDLSLQHMIIIVDACNTSGIDLYSCNLDRISCHSSLVRTKSVLLNSSESGVVSLLHNKVTGRRMWVQLHQVSLTREA